MERDYHRLLLVFADGVGLAPAAGANPLAVAPSPHLDRLLGPGGLTAGSEQSRNGLLLKGIDATLGVDGLPQSATGQTALFTGENGAALLGRHATGLPGSRLRRLIARASVFRRVTEAGLATTFANAYTRGYLDALAAGSARASVTTCAVAAAGLDWRTEEHLAAGRAVTWDIERDLFGRPLTGRAIGSPVRVEPIAARRAGRHLGRLAGDHELTVFETFLPDLAGHGRIGLPAAEVVRRLDDFLAGVLETRAPETTVVLTSDHGNLEDGGVRTHTRNPVPLLAVGPAAPRLATVDSIVEVAPCLLRILGAASS